MANKTKWHLRDFGVYLLPDGREAVAVPEADGCHLFLLANWPARSKDVGDYVAYPSGLIRKAGALTGWHSKGLKDTGRTARV